MQEARASEQQDIVDACQSTIRLMMPGRYPADYLGSIINDQSLRPGNSVNRIINDPSLRPSHSPNSIINDPSLQSQDSTIRRACFGNRTQPSNNLASILRDYSIQRSDNGQQPRNPPDSNIL